MPPILQAAGAAHYVGGGKWGARPDQIYTVYLTIDKSQTCLQVSNNLSKGQASVHTYTLVP